MKPFIHDDFLLTTDRARALYHEYAAPMPIIDYHCHLPPGEIAEDKRWENLARIWLYGDHYKWRAMRTNGVAERFCTGDATDREKFDKWAETMPYLLRNPLYHWTHLELARYFDLTELFGPESADRIWDVGRERLAQPEFSCRGLMLRSNVELVCTTDDPVDSLADHAAIAADPSFPVRVLPTWRPDRSMGVEAPRAFNAWTDRLGEAADVDVRDFGAFVEALRRRHAFFHERGCRLSDYGVETVYADEYTQSEIESIFLKVRSGRAPDEAGRRKFRSAMHHLLSVMDRETDWTMQIHYGAMRNNNTAMFKALGPDKGFDSIGDLPIAEHLSRHLDRLSSDGGLPRTILYNLNPRDNELLAAMIGNFQDGSMPGKLQHGSGWWFLDQKNGMERQMESLSQLGLLSRFVGMVTDSRSFLSYTRHEYFRRILCNMLGRDMAQGAIPDDLELVGRMVRDIAHDNAARYFGFAVESAESGSALQNKYCTQ